MANGTDQNLDVVQHPTLGPLKFPKSMPFDQRNQMIEQMEQQQSPPSQVYQRTPGTAEATVSAQAGGISNWLQNLEADVRYGGARTAVGKVLSTLGAQGTDVGAQAGTQDANLASPVLGPIHTLQGIAMTPQHPIAGPLKTLGGMWQTASLPTQFIGGPITSGAGEVTGTVAKALTPSTRLQAAGNAIQEVTNAVGNTAVDVNVPGQSALRIQEL